MKLKTRLIVAGLTLWILGIAVLLNDGAGAFFGQMSNGTCDYYTMTHADVCENLPVNGTCYVVYDYIAASVTEETDKYTGKQTSTDNAYYYVTDFSCFKVPLPAIDISDDLKPAYTFET